MRRLLTIAALLAAPVLSHAAETGADIVRSGLPGGIAPCGVCHEESGAGKPGVGAPRLAGQYEAYLRGQLRDFASGDRPSPIMSPISRRLDVEQMAALAAYFVDQRAPVPPYKSFPKDVVQRGSDIAQQGLAEARVQACTTCHGPLGRGSPPDVPYIAGQAPGYIKSALQAFEAGKRESDPHKTMRHVASGLSDEDIHALAAYFSTLPPPGAHGNKPLSLANEKPEQP